MGGEGIKLAINGAKPVRENFLIFGSPQIKQDEIDEVVDSLKSGWLSTGPKAKKFEEMFREYIGSKYAIALNSCTAGLYLSLLCCNIGNGDEVITTPMTFAATANVIEHVGAKPVFVDVGMDTININPEKILEKINAKTKAMLPVHFAGRPCNMDKICRIASENSLKIIEDGAHCIEGFYRGKKIGTIGDLTGFSFYVTKNLCCGEGGMVTTNNKDFAEKIQIYALHGLSKGAWGRYSDEGFKHYQVIVPGYKYNMMDLQAALGIHQLKRIEENLKRREEIWKKYDKAFKDLSLVTPKEPEPNTRHARHLYTILLNLEELEADRDKIQQALYKENIGTGIHFISLHLHPYYKSKYRIKKEDFPNAAYISDRTISLPLSSKLTDEDVRDVIEAVTKVLQFFRK